MDKLIMNTKERKQLVVFKKLEDGDITKVQAADMLDMSYKRTRINS